MLRRALEVRRGCGTMLGMLGNAKRKLNRTGKDIRTLGEIGQKKNHEKWHQGFPGDHNGCLDDVK
jgi:hypothetical protein